MSDNSNTQTPPPAPPAGPTVEELQAKLAEFEKSREGLIRDVQDERRRRQEAEQRLSTPTPAPSANKTDVGVDELGKVLKPYIDPVRKEAADAKAMLARYQEDRALDHIASKLGKSKADIMADKAFQERFTNTQKRYGIVGQDLVDLSNKTLELMELEDLRVKEAERVRNAAAASGSGMPNGTPPPPVGSKETFSKDDFAKMDMLRYEKLSSAGDFIEDPETGKIVYTPRK